MLNPNTTFANRYLLEERIGMGGFSEVWRARDGMTEDSIVAIKIYAAEQGLDEYGLRQFRREYASMLNISHEHVVTAKHFDIWDSRPYLIMTYMEGGSLYRQMMERGPMEEKQIAEVLLQLSKGLSFLHARGILHQDIKPENVLMDSEGRYYLTDFGISTRLRSTLRKTVLKADRSMTVSYAPPERFSGDQEATKGGDVFSLGVMVYEMAKGELPWMGAGGVVLHPSSAPLELPKGYSAQLTELVNHCIRLHPADRPRASDLVDKCNNFLSSGNWGNGVEAEKKEKPPSNPKGLYFLIGGLVLLLIGILAVQSADRSANRSELPSQVEQRVWTEALDEGTEQSYGLYLDKYPNGRYSTKARTKLRELKKEAENSGQREVAASAENVEDKVWIEALEENSRSSYDEYLYRYPYGRYASQARSKMKEMERQEREELVYPLGTVHCDPANPTAVVEVLNPATGKTWMDRNLGASRVATSSTDAAAYGDLYQWGRSADGHQCRNSYTTTRLSSSNNPGHSDLIVPPSSPPWDWRSPQNNNLWQGVNGINNPCPAGYRLPTDSELAAELQSWSSSNSDGAFASPLRLSMAGGRYDSRGSLLFVGTFGQYWSSAVSGTDSRYLTFISSDASMLTNTRAYGFSVRCIKD
jgi:uncharacterized protein (TIGR02145 family)